MKGTIFVELIKMAEDAFGEDAVDTILDDAGLENGGAFTSVGNYPCSELVKIVLAFSQHSGLQPDVLQKMFGHWMLKHFAEHYPHFFLATKQMRSHCSRPLKMKSMSRSVSCTQSLSYQPFTPSGPTLENC